MVRKYNPNFELDKVYTHELSGIASIRLGMFEKRVKVTRVTTNRLVNPSSCQTQPISLDF
jgi:hypothetical protein